MSTFETIKRVTARPAVSALVSGTIGALVGGSGSVNLFGMNMPNYVAAGISGAVAVEASEIAHSYILPHVPLPEKWNKTESMILTPLLQGGIFYGMIRAGNPGFSEGTSLGPAWLTIGGLGAVSAVASEYAYSALEPMIFSGTSGQLGGGL